MISHASLYFIAARCCYEDLPRLRSSVPRRRAVEGTSLFRFNYACLICLYPGRRWYAPRLDVSARVSPLFLPLAAPPGKDFTVTWTLHGDCSTLHRASGSLCQRNSAVCHAWYNLSFALGVGINSYCYEKVQGRSFSDVWMFMKDIPGTRTRGQFLATFSQRNKLSFTFSPLQP